jgi:hypothetical protein
MTILLEPTIRAVEANERDRVVETITSAFAADPAARWTPARRAFRCTNDMGSRSSP